MDELYLSIFCFIVYLLNSVITKAHLFNTLENLFSSHANAEKIKIDTFSYLEIQTYFQ